MYAQVVVPSYKGPNESGFTYEIHSGLEVRVGQLVTVPFGRRQEIGIVLSIVDRPLTIVKNIKLIDSVIFDKPFLLPYQLELLKWMGKYYLAGSGNCANAILPQLPRNLNRGSTLSFRQGRTSSAGSQILVLVPTVNNIPQTMALFPKATKPLVFHSELKPQEKLEAWLKTMSGNCNYVFGTRQAIFLPYPKLRKIIVINEHDDAYKDQRSPYYDTLTIAEKVADLTKAKIEVIDPGPRITTYFQTEEIKRFFLVLRTRKNLKEPSVKIVSMAEERKVGNKSAISDELKYRIEENIKVGGNTLLYLNKKKESGTLYCNKCKYQEAFPKAPQKCPNCGNEQIYFASLNVVSLAKLVQKMFPDITVNVITDNAVNTSIVDRPSTIDVATSAVFYKLLPKHYNLVAAITIDSTLNVPEYTAPEKTYALITTLKRLTTKTLILQTYNPENSTLTSAAISAYPEFYREQTEERKTLLYPPFSILVKLVVKGKNEEKTLTKAEELAEKVRDTLEESRVESRETSNQLPATSYPLPTVLGPFGSYFRRAAKVYNIVVKIPIKSYTIADRLKAIESITPALESANVSRIADQIVVDPTSLN